MKNFIVILLTITSNYLFSQNGFPDWDKSYTYEKAENIIQNEIDYAKKVDQDKTEGSYYVAMSKFRFIATFTGKERPINSEVLNSMKRVFKIKTGSNKILNDLVSKEFEFNIGKTRIWMPIQNQIMTAFRNEVKKDKKVLLYTLFTNEHQFKGGIINTFLISEFTTDWN
ncbi:hypothetical protein [Tenacibaculum sp. 190524A05c]|uniref:Uncharacterized protein n=1 Tax=Tenacibaculum platacis TaxID=3137852 RepID=A0ABM9P2F8_9FLAO